MNQLTEVNNGGKTSKIYSKPLVIVWDYKNDLTVAKILVEIKCVYCGSPILHIMILSCKENQSSLFRRHIKNIIILSDMSMMRYWHTVGDIAAEIMIILLPIV